MKTNHLDEVIRRLKDLSESPTAVINKDWVQVVMSQFRQHVEAQGAEGNYRVLMFYCNWNLHTKLDRGIVQDFLKDISDVICNEQSGHPADRISEILSMTKLRNEIRNILGKEGIEAGIFEIDSNWKSFTELMFPFLLNKPLHRKRSITTHHWVESLELYDNTGKLFWRIKVMPGNSEFIGPILRTY